MVGSDPNSWRGGEPDPPRACKGGRPGRPHAAGRLVIRAAFGCACALLAMSAGCGLLVGIPDGRYLAIEEGGASSGAQAGAGGETGVPPDRTDAADAPALDDGAQDSSMAEAGGSDASTASTPFCARVDAGYVLCDSFDDGGFGDFTAQQPLRGQVLVDPTEARSPPDALHATVSDAGSADPLQQLALGAATLGAASYGTVDLFFDLWLDDVSEAQNVYPVALQIGDSTLYLYVTAGSSIATTGAAKLQARVGSGSFGGDTPLSQAPPLRAWTHVEMRLSPAQGTLEVRFDGVDVLAPDAGPLSSLDASWTAGPVSLRLGLTSMSAANVDLSVHVDDVLVYAE